MSTLNHSLSLSKHFYWRNSLLSNRWIPNVTFYYPNNARYISQNAYLTRARILTSVPLVRQTSNDKNNSKLQLFEQQIHWFSQYKSQKITQHKQRERMPMKLSQYSKIRKNIANKDSNDKWSTWGRVIEHVGKLLLKLDALFLITLVCGAMGLSFYQKFVYGQVTWTQGIRQWARRRAANS